jgi:structural hemagglutinin/hemolysin toxin protein RtxA|tara:strand:- start:12280 stop:12597 length:318 start_codon:yes stop_codon:yes gene_type:complete
VFKLCFYVPQSHLETVKTAVFATGAGRIGDYDNCCWQALGQGQFRPLDGSKPFIGQHGEVEVVAEYRVEMVCESAFVRATVAALIEAHPYETPAWDLVLLVTELP